MNTGIAHIAKHTGRHFQHITGGSHPKAEGFQLDFHNVNKTEFEKSITKAQEIYREILPGYKTLNDNPKGEKYPTAWIPTVLTPTEKQEAQKRIEVDVKKLQEFTKDTEVVIAIGFGGSFVNAHYLTNLHGVDDSKRVIYVKDVKDATDAIRLAKDLKKKTTILATSLSGNTPGVKDNLEYTYKNLQQAQIKPKVGILTNTDKKNNSLVTKVKSNLKIPKNQTLTVHIDPSIGGRYSMNQVNGVGIATSVIKGLELAELNEGFKFINDNPIITTDSKPSLPVMLLAWSIYKENSWRDKHAPGTVLESYSLYPSASVAKAHGELRLQLDDESTKKGKEQNRYLLPEQILSGENAHHSSGEAFQTPIDKIVTVYNLLSANDIEMLKNSLGGDKAIKQQHNYVLGLTSNVVVAGTPTMVLSVAGSKPTAINAALSTRLALSQYLHTLGIAKFVGLSLLEKPITQEYIEKGKKENQARIQAPNNNSDDTDN